VNSDGLDTSLSQESWSEALALAECGNAPSAFSVVSGEASKQPFHQCFKIAGRCVGLFDFSFREAHGRPQHDRQLLIAERAKSVGAPYCDFVVNLRKGGGSTPFFVNLGHPTATRTIERPESRQPRKWDAKEVPAAATSDFQRVVIAHASA
jgi:hypothetical protein